MRRHSVRGHSLFFPRSCPNSPNRYRRGQQKIAPSCRKWPRSLLRTNSCNTDFVDRCGGVSRHAHKTQSLAFAAVLLGPSPKDSQRSADTSVTGDSVASFVSPVFFSLNQIISTRGDCAGKRQVGRHIVGKERK